MSIQTVCIYKLFLLLKLSMGQIHLSNDEIWKWNCGDSALDSRELDFIY